MKEARKIIALVVVALVLLMAYQVPYVQSAISQLIGIGVYKGNFEYTQVKDAALPANNQMSDGIPGAVGYINNGTGADIATVGSQFYAVKRANITTASVNIAFGFPSKKISIETPTGNTDEVCIDWGGGTAVCPAANTAGDDRMAAGRITILDDFVGTSISVIAASGTQTVYIRAWR